MTKHPWTLTVSDYIGPHRVAENEPHAPARDDQGRRLLARMDAASRDWPRVSLPERPDLDLRLEGPTRLVVRDADTGDILGGYTPAFPYVLPEHRGRGICAEMHCAADASGVRRGITYYSESGFHARLKAHRLHVERAIARGEDVPGRVLADYERTGSGTLVLSGPYGRDEHNARVVEREDAAARERHARETRDMTHSFQALEERGLGSFLHLSPCRGGIWLADRLSREHGSAIRVTVADGVARAAQAQIGEHVVDIYGIRPADRALDELLHRYPDIEGDTELPLRGYVPPREVAVRIFETAGELRKAMTAEGASVWSELRAPGGSLDKDLARNPGWYRLEVAVSELMAGTDAEPDPEPS